jgi:CPA2 family monovalent cation:H+ antiporter-2
LPAHSPFIGKPLSESKIREEFGVNIVVIERGDIVINVPGRNEQLYPNDIISVIGTDDQLNEFKSYLESYDHDSVTDARRRNISLFHFTVNEDSKLIGQSIRGSKIRERTNGLIVGIERRGKRILNPESDEIFEVNDKLWLVGSEMRIQVILKEMTPQDTSKT